MDKKLDTPSTLSVENLEFNSCKIKLKTIKLLYAATLIGIWI